MSRRPLPRLLLFVCLFVVALAPALRAQRQMEALGRGVVAVRPNSTNVYIGWRLLGDDPSDIAFNLYRSVNGATATKLNASPITASTNYTDTPGSTALAGNIAYHVVPVLNGVEQTASAAYTLTPATLASQQFISLPLATTTPNPASTAPYNVKFCWVGDFDGDGEYDFLVDRVSTAATAERQYLEAYKRDGTFLWRMDMGPNSVEQYAYEPGSSAISVGDTDNVTVYDLDGDGRAEVAVRTSNGVTVTNATGQVVATVSAATETAQFVSIIDGLSGSELARAPLPNPWAQHGTLTNKCAIAYLDGRRPSVLFYGYNRADSGAFYRVFTTFDYRGGQLTQRWSTPQTFHGSEGHQIRVADVDNDGKDEIIDIGHVIDDDGTQLFDIGEISHGDRFHVADINPDRPGLENFVIQQNNPSFLATAYYDAGTGEMIKKWYATDVVDVGRGLVGDLTSAHKGYEFFSTQAGIYNALGEQIQATGFFPYEGLWWDADLLREIIAAADGNGYNPIINKYNQSSGGMDRLWSIYSDFGSFVNRTAYGGRPAFWGDILGDWREELIFVTSDFASIRIYTPTSTATNRLYTLMHNPAYRMQATTKGYVQASYVDYYLGAGMTPPPPPPMVRADLAWSGSGSSTWDAGATSTWSNTATGASSTFAAGQSVRFDLAGNNSASVALSGSLQPAAVTVYLPGDYTFDGAAGSLAGTMKLVKAGKGALRVTGAHAYTGSTTVWDGALRIDGSLTGSPVTVWGGTWGGALAKGLGGGRLSGSGSIAQPVTLGYRGALSPGAGASSAGTITLGAGLTAQDGSVLVLDLSTDPSGTTLANDRVAITGNLALSGTVSVVVNALSGQLAPGTYTLATYTGTLTGSASNLSIVVPEGTPYTVGLGSGALTLVIPVTREPDTIDWTGSVSGIWDLAVTNNWRFSGAPTGFVAGDTVVFGDAGSTRPAVTLNTSAPVAGVSFTGATSYTLSGSGAIAGAGGLAKSGSGVVTLNTANTFTGPVSVTGGVLAVSALADGGQPSAIGASASDAANFTLDGGTLRLVGSQTNTNRSVTLGAAGGVIHIPTGSTTLQISGSFTGSGALTKSGSGSLILANANTHAGGTVLQAGTLILASDTANESGISSAGITLQGGTLRMYDNINTSSAVTSSWPITVPAGASARFETDGRCTIAGALTGSGTLDFNTTYVRTALTGNWSAFAGTLNVTTDTDGGDFRISNTAGLGNATVNLASTAYAYSIVSSSHTYAIGALTGSGTLAGNNTNSGRTLTWQIGAKNLDTTFSGVIANNTGPAALTKVGAGTLTLTGASTYTGATSVSAGKLVLSGGSLAGSAVTVASGAGFGGNGSVTGNVTFAAGSTLLANPSAGPLAITGNLTLSGAVTVAPVPGAALVAGTYPLYTYTGTLTGTPSFTWNGPGYSATFNTATAGQVSITLVKTINPPTNLVVLPGLNQASLSWTAPAGAVSYRVLRATVSGGPYATVATGLTTTTHTDTGLTNGITYYYVATAVASDGSTSDSTQASVSVGGNTPRLRWRLDETSGSTATDTSGNGWHGALVNAPVWSAARLDNGLSLASASSQHATAPSGVVNGLADFTLSIWVRPTTLANWARIVDFGSGTANYLFLASRTTSNFPRFAIRTASVNEQVINSSVSLATGVWQHLAVTVSGSTGTLYLNGVAVGSNTAMTLTPSSLGATTLNYLGRSQFSADPYFNGAVDEFLLFERALTASEIAVLAAPPAAPAGLSATAGVAQASLAWSAVSGSSGYALKRADSAAAPFALVADNLIATNRTDTGLAAGTAYRYIVTNRQGVAESANSAVATVTPFTPMEGWRFENFGSSTATGDAANDADPDSDGIVNLLEYALGGNPQAASTAILPVSDISSDHLRLTFTRVADPAIVYTVQGVDDLASVWNGVWSSTGAANTSGPVTVSDSEPLSDHPRRFLRLQVAAP